MTQHPLDCSNDCEYFNPSVLLLKSHRLIVNSFPDLDESAGGSKTDDEERKRRRACLFSDKISYAFQLATNQGPLCQEPVQGIAVIIEDVTLTETGDEDIGRLTGEVIRLVRDAVAQGFLDWSPRILLAMYSCEIQASSKCSIHYY